MDVKFKIICVLMCSLIVISSITACNNSNQIESSSSDNESIYESEIETNSSSDIISDESTENSSSEKDVVTTEEKIESTSETTEAISDKTSETTIESTETISVTSTDTIETSTESTSSYVETTEVETVIELVEDVVSFVDYTRKSRSFYDLKKDGDIGLSFKVPSGQVKKLYLCLSDTYGYIDCSINVNIYAFSGSYGASVKTEPIYTEYITSTPKTYTIEFDDGLLTEGSYLIVLSYVEPELTDENTTEASTAEVHGKVIQDYFWYKVTIPEGYDAYEMKSFYAGSNNKKYAFCGGITVEHYVGKAVEEQDEETVFDESETEESENIAKVILLAGQSNATGATVGSYLSDYISPDKYQEYLEGYSNVKILYSSGTISGGKLSVPNSSVTFVDTKLGQGISNTRFGPELGLAEYLNKNYPNETFYIIKYAIGASGLQAHWNPLDESRSICLKEFDNLIYQGLLELQFQGYTPEIVGFLWMQGEADASSANSAYQYYTYQDELVKFIRENYAYNASDIGIPFIDAAVSEEGMWSSAFLVNEMKHRYSLSSDINEFIDTNKEGLTCLQENNDPAHYDSRSMILLGQLYGEALSKFLD